MYFYLVIIFFSENCTIFDVQVKFKTNLTSELDASLTTAVESVRQSGVQFQGQKYAITETPVISVPNGKSSSTAVPIRPQLNPRLLSGFTRFTLGLLLKNVRPLGVYFGSSQG